VLRWVKGWAVKLWKRWSCEGPGDLHRLVVDGCAASLKRALERGVPVDQRDPQGRTPLMWALLLGAEERLVRLLLEAGADVNATDSRGRTPLHYALMGGCGARVLEVLIRGGAVARGEARDLAHGLASVLDGIGGTLGVPVRRGLEGVRSR